MSKAPPYNAAYFEGTFKDEDPVSWWKSAVKMGFDQNLAKVAISLVSAASSSGRLERCFSTLGTTYGKLRTWMGVEKAGKIGVYVPPNEQKVMELLCKNICF